MSVEYRRENASTMISTNNKYDTPSNFNIFIIDFKIISYLNNIIIHISRETEKDYMKRSSDEKEDTKNSQDFF